MGDVLRLADEANTGTSVSDVVDRLRELADALESGPELEPVKALILMLDDRDQGYAHGFRNVGMSMSECLALLEVSKVQVLEQMGLLNA